MKIGIDIRLQNETGVGRYIRNLVKLLPKIAPQHTYIHINPPIQWHSFEEQLNMPGIIDSMNLDLVHIPYFNVPLYIKTPFVMTMHDLIVDQFGTGRASTLPFPLYYLKRLGYTFVTASAMNRARAVIVPSETVKQDVMKFYKVVDEKIKVTYEGVDDILHNKLDKPNLNITSHKFFLYVGNAYPHKNLDRLLEAFNRLNTDVKLVLVGKENYFYNRLYEKIQNDERVIYAGYISDEELFWLYKNTKALVFPSLAEGFGLPALEAMKIGTPILASDIAVFKELFHDIPLYFDPYNAEEIKKALEKALKESFTSQRQQGKKLAESFSWKKMTQQTVRIYESSTRL